MSGTADFNAVSCDQVLGPNPANPAAQLPKHKLNPRALVFVSSPASSEISSPQPGSEADPQEAQPDRPNSAAGELQQPDSADLHEQQMHRSRDDNLELPREQNFGWESPQGVLPPGPYYPAMPSPSPAETAAPKEEAQDPKPRADAEPASAEPPAADAPPPARRGGGAGGGIPQGPSAAMQHHAGAPTYSWGGPYPVWYHEAASLERSGSPPAVYYPPAGGSPPPMPAGGSPPLAPGFISIPLHRGAILDPGSPTAQGQMMYAQGGSPTYGNGGDGYGHGHGGSPTYGASPPHSLGSSPPGGHYMYAQYMAHAHGEYHQYGHHAMHPAPQHPHPRGHHNQHHQHGGGLAHGPGGPEYLSHHMGGLSLGPGSSTSGGGGGGGPSRASARIARSHRAGGAYNPSEFDFSLAEADAGGEGARTTLMIRNVPNKYHQATMLEVLHKAGFSGEFDFFYLPIDFRNRCGLGYAFINMMSPAAAARLYRAFHDKRWDEFNSKKVCEIKYARVQGRDALVDHFRTAKFPSEDADYQPLVFTPRESPEGGGELVAVDPKPIHAFLGTSATGRAPGVDGASPRSGGSSPPAAIAEGAKC